MARALLMRGMLVGVIAALLAVLFARIVAEPQIDLAIAFEASREAAEHAMAEPEVVSRATQKGLGLLTAVGLYGAAVGGIFSLVFTATYGRLGLIGPRTLALLLACGAFLAIVIVPALKYPPNPPAVGLHETVGLRTATYFALIGCSVAFLALAVRAARAMAPRLGGFNAGLVGAGGYAVLIAITLVVLPAINEVPADFPAVVLWRFRVASMGTQALLWSVIGLGFGLAADHALRAAHRAGAIAGRD